MALTLFNTLTRSKEVFVPADEERVTMYVCGPTVYSYAHIGNARPPVVFDVLYRLLKRRYPRVIYARNITDIDDKIMTAAQAEGVDIDTIAERFTEIYRQDMAALGVSAMDIEPRATEHLPGMIAMMATLIERNHAYVRDGHVLFDVTSDDDYGKLSNRSLDQLIAGARVEVASYKRHPADFVLWKPSSEDQPGWDSPWGRGRPGWHLECSVMAAQHLGETIDIHGGGCDLVFPHHENELAQSRCTHGGKPLAHYWLHNGFLTMSSEKMSKSIGNVRTVNDLLQEYRGEQLRLLLLTAHYRQPLDWCEEGLTQAGNILDRIYRCLDRLEPINAGAGEPPPQFVSALEDDLNTPRALAVIADLVNQANKAEDQAEQVRLKSTLLACGEWLGLMTSNPSEWLKGDAREDGNDDHTIDALVAERDAARADRDFARADEIRDQLSRMNITIDDGASGSKWRRS